MSRIVEAAALSYRDLFALPNGSVYETRSTTAGALQARLWCAHPPDPITFSPPQIDLTPGQMVQLLSRDETRSHIRHEGYVRAVFEQEMERRFSEQMQLVDARTQRAHAATQERERALRPWWKKLFRSRASS
jgi:hypothetical protein